MYASATDSRQVAVIDTNTLSVVATMPADGYADALAYAPDVGKVYVSDEQGGSETVVDVSTNQRAGTVSGGGEAGNTPSSLSTTRPGMLLKRQVAIKTFSDWTETEPGFVEVDLVAQCGWTGAGPFLYTLTVVDAATGWVSCAAVRDKRAQTVLVALRRLHEGLPFKLRGLDSDCGSEFLNTTLIEYCTVQHITFTRGRPYRKNDGCHVEQKNWAVVRRLVGYQRLEAPALAALESVHDLARDYVNFLHPVRRLTEKVRFGARVTRRYDTAQTPYRRLLASGCLSQKAARELATRWKRLDPLRLKLELESAQRTLAERAIQPAVRHPLRSDHL